MSKRLIQNKEYPHLNLPFDIAANSQQVIELIVKPRLSLLKTTTLTNGDYKNSIFHSTPISKELKETISFYKNTNEAFYHSLHYMFHKIGMGIYVYIVDNNVQMFVPFANMNFVNDWHHLITYDNDIADIKAFNKKNRIRDKVFSDPQYWNTNNCLIGNLRETNGFPISSYRIREIYNLLTETCKKHKIKDVEFFVNKRDFPVIKHNLTEPYHHIYNSYNKKMQKYMYNSYLPIMSMTGSKDFADIKIPTDDDISILFRQRHFSHNIVPPIWENKIPVAMFRGTATGSGVTVSTNQRLKLAHLTSKIPTLNAQITSWNKRPKKHYCKPLTIINPQNLPFKLGQKLSIDQQIKYKYLIQVDGHVSAFRLSWMLQSRSTILMVESNENYTLWFQKLLQPWVHYVPVKHDLSDLQDKINWCINNDAESKKIAERAYKVYIEFVGRPLDYMAYVLNVLHS